MLLWDDGATVRTRVVRPDGTLGPAQVALSDAALVWEGDFEAPLWQVRDDGKGTVVVASRTAVVQPNVSGGGVVAAIRDPGGPFGPQQTLHPAESTTHNAQASVAISLIAPNGTVSVGWDLEDSSGAPQGLVGPWRQATRTGRAASFGPASPPSTGSFGVPVDIEGPQTDAQGGRSITVGSDVVRLCQTSWVSCFDRHILPLDGREALVFRVTTGLVQDQTSTFVPETLLEGLWAADRGADGTFTRPRRVTFTETWQPVGSVDGRGLLLAGSSTGPLTLTPVGRDVISRPATPRAQRRFNAEGSRSQVLAWCTRRCTLSARLRYAGQTGRSAVHPRTIPTPPRRTLDPGERGLIPLRLTAGPQAKRLTLTLTARDMRGRSRTTTVRYRRVGRIWKQVVR